MKSLGSLFNKSYLTKAFLLFSIFLIGFNAKASDQPCYLMDGSPYFAQLDDDYEGQFNSVESRLKFRVVVSDFLDSIKKCGDQRMMQKIIKEKELFSIDKVIVNGKDVGLIGLKKNKDEFSFDLPLNKGFNLVEIKMHDSFGMPVDFQNGKNELKLWAGDRNVKVIVSDESGNKVQDGTVELLLKTQYMNVKEVVNTDKNGVASFTKIPDYKRYVKQGMVFIIAQKSGFLGNSIVEDKNEIKVTVKGFDEPVKKAEVEEVTVSDEPVIVSEEATKEIEVVEPVKTKPVSDNVTCNTCATLKSFKIVKRPELPKSMMPKKKKKK